MIERRRFADGSGHSGVRIGPKSKSSIRQFACRLPAQVCYAWVDRRSEGSDGQGQSFSLHLPSNFKNTVFFVQILNLFSVRDKKTIIFQRIEPLSLTFWVSRRYVLGANSYLSGRQSLHLGFAGP